MLGVLLCFVASVHDGDTFRCRTGERIRLAAIDAPELGRPGGAASREALIAVALGRTARCQPLGRSYRRVVARCSVAGLDLSCHMLRARRAIIVRRFDHRHELAPCQT